MLLGGSKISSTTDEPRTRDEIKSQKKLKILIYHEFQEDQSFMYGKEPLINSKNTWEIVKYSKILLLSFQIYQINQKNQFQTL